MKKTYVAIILGVTLCVLATGGCVASDRYSKDSDKAGTTVCGEVKRVEEDSITISVETEDDKTEEQKIEVEDDTVIVRQQTGPSGEMPERPDGEASDGNAPEKPDGDAPTGNAPDGDAPAGNAPDGNAPDGNAPEKPDGNASDGNAPTGNAPEKPDGNAPDGDAPSSEEEISLADIETGDQVEITYDAEGDVEQIAVIAEDMPMGQPGGMQQASGVDSYEAVHEYTAETVVDGEEITSTGTDENAVLVSADTTVTLQDVAISRTSKDSTGGDNSSFYGVGAAALATDGDLYISGSDIDTDASGAAGVFAYGDATVYVSDTSIHTKQDASGGIHAAGGGALYAWDVEAETEGQSSAAVRSDRGGGTMVIDGGSYTSNGIGSPAVYTTAEIAVHDAALTANASEAVCIEGLNSLRLYDCDLSGNMGDDEQNDCTWNVILYQSMSGDSEVGNSTFEMDGGTLTAKNGGMFYTTNTESTITLKDVDITYAKENDFFLRCTGNQNARGWGNSGENGADCTFTAISQEMEGDIIWDSISELDFYMTNGSSLTGAVLDDESCAGNGGDGGCSLTIDAGSVWTVTGDSVLGKLSCAGAIRDVDGKSVTIKGSDGTVYVEGESPYTVTVDSYEDTADVSDAAEISSWDTYEVEKPEV